MTDLEDMLTCQQIDFLLAKYQDMHGPWPVDIKFYCWKNGDRYRDVFKSCFYRRLHQLSVRSDTWDCYEEEPEAI